MSIVIPAYNAESHIEEALSCISAQRFSCFEAIVVDDGSTDETSRIVQAFCEKDERFRYIRQENSGAAAARNVGIEHAQGEYLAFVDADDAFEPAFLFELVRAIKDSDADVAVCQADSFINDVSNPIDVLCPALPQSGYYSRAQLEQRLFQSFNATPWNKLFKSTFVRDNNLRFQSLHHSNDTYFVLAAIGHADTIAVVNRVLVHYRMGTGSSLRDDCSADPLCDFYALDAVRERLNSDGLLGPAIRRSLDERCVDCALFFLTHYASHAPSLARKMYDAYFDQYLPKWGITRDSIKRGLPRLLVMKHCLIERAGFEGLIWACKGDNRERTDIRGFRHRLRFAARLWVAPMTCKRVAPLSLTVNAEERNNIE